MKKITLLFLLTVGLFNAGIQANITFFPSSQPANPEYGGITGAVDAFAKTQPQPITAYDIAAHFAPDKEQKTDGIAALLTTTFGTALEFNNGSVNHLYGISIAALSSTQFVVCYRDEDDNNHGEARVGTVSGTSITYSTTTIDFNTGSTDVISAYALSSTQFVVAFQDESNSNHGTAMVGTVSGTGSSASITFSSSEFVFNAASNSYISVSALSSTQFVVAFRDFDNSSHGTAMVGTVSGTGSSASITFSSSEFVFNAAGTYMEPQACRAMNPQKFVVVFDDFGDSDKGHAIIGTVSGTGSGATIRFGAEEEFANTTWYPTMAPLSDAPVGPPPAAGLSQYVVAYDNRDDSNHGWARIGENSSLLPVEMTYFKGRLQDNLPHLAWQTASELGNLGFDIERSAKGWGDWKSIGFVSGNGTTFETQDHTFTDIAPLKGINYYRLRQTDIDGRSYLSPVVTVEMPEFQSLSNFKIVPNPVQNGELTLYIPNEDMEQATLEIYNAVGQLIRTQVLTSNQATISVSDLSKGMYLFTLNLDGQQSVEKVIIE